MAKRRKNQFPLHVPISIIISKKKSILYIRNPKKFVNLTDFFFGVGKTVGLEKTSNLFHLKKTNPHLKVQSTSRPAPMVVGKMSWQSASGIMLVSLEIKIVTSFRWSKNMGRKPPYFRFFFERRQKPKRRKKNNVFKKGMAALKLVDACLITLMTDA